MAERNSRGEIYIYGSGSGVTLTGYADDGADIVVIPETISGEKGTAIAEGTFSGTEFEEIFISRNITTIADGAVKNCGLKVCRMSDSVVNISDCAFADCDDFSTLIINAVCTPTYQNTQHGSYAVKYERLMTSRSPKLIITSGSSSAYEFLSEQFIGEIGEAGCGDWDVVNYACHYQTPGVFYIDVISNFISAGDVVLHSPEPLAAQLGSVKITPVMWQFFEGAYEAFSLVDTVQKNDPIRIKDRLLQYKSELRYDDGLSVSHSGFMSAYADCGDVCSENLVYPRLAFFDAACHEFMYEVGM